MSSKQVQIFVGSHEYEIHTVGGSGKRTRDRGGETADGRRSGWMTMIGSAEIDTENDDATNDSEFRESNFIMDKDN